MPAAHSRPRPAKRLAPALLGFLLCLWSAAGQAQSARWENHRAAALRAVDEVDYAEAIVQFEAAIYYAEATPAADRDLADLWENLTAAYLADAQYRRVWDAIARWDKVLVANADEPWVTDQRGQRDQMTRLLFDQLRQARDEAAAAVEP